MSSSSVEQIKIGVVADSGIEPLILKRWSPRAFSDRSIDASDLKKLFVAASWAPSCFNEQPWRFIVGHKGDVVFGRIVDALTGFNRHWAATAPVLFLTAAKKTFSRNGSPSEFHIHDTGLASAMLSLQATALGLHTHGMAGFDKVKARAAFSIPEDFDLCAAWAIGYLGDPNALPEPYRELEKSPRSRKPLGEFVFSEWNWPARFGL
jgi:nitroreductase